MNKATVEWYTPGGAVPEVVGTGGALGDFYVLVEKCRAGSWPPKAEVMQVLNAAGKTINDLVLESGTAATAPKPVQQPAHRKPKTVNVVVNNPAPVPRVAAVTNINTIAEDSKERSLLQEFEAEYTKNAELIAKMGVDKLAYIQSRMRTELVRRGVDPRAAGL